MNYLPSLLADMKTMGDEELSEYAFLISDTEYYEQHKQDQELSSDGMISLFREITRELMRRNLAIPDGTALSMMEMAEVLANEPEFKGKYEAV